MKIGSLFSGYGGLDLAVMGAVGGDVVWHCEWDDAPARILEYHFPGVPNYRDVSTVDWTQVERVDVLTGGFPCQDVSLAGRRAGMKEGTRSGLWSEFAKAIDVLRPRLVVIENVRGLLSAAAGNDVEPCAWCLGDDSGEPALRALGAVLGELADLGYDAEWVGVRASDAGAPHGRFRVFVVAYPCGGGGGGWASESGQAGGDDAPVGSGAGGTGARSVVADAGGDESKRWGAVRNMASSVGVARDEAGKPDEGGDAASNRRAAFADSENVGHERAGAPRFGRHGLTDGGNVTTADSDSGRLELIGRIETVERDLDRRGSAHTTWGDYEPAIRRWESITSRLAPAPTLADGKNGQHRLSAPFVEWMMGLPEGWVTSPQIGLTRNQQLRALGNGVVPQQAALALRELLAVAS